MLLFKFSIITRISEIISHNFEFDHVSFMFKDKEIKLAEMFESFEVKIDSLNDFFFEDFFIILNKSKKNWYGKTKKIAYVKIKARNFQEMSNKTLEFDLISFESWSTVDYHNKKEIKVGIIKLEVETVELHQPFESETPKNSITGFINKIISLETKSALQGIKNMADILFNGGPVLIMKNFFGFILTESIFNKTSVCIKKSHRPNHGCFFKNCLEGYGSISSEKATEAVKIAKYALASYLDSTFINLLIKKKNNKFKHVKNKKIRAALEWAEDIPEENLVKYFEGDRNKIGHVYFVEKSKFIISLRGTLSHNDIISDINCGYKPFLNGYTHVGISQMTDQFIVDELDFILTEMKKRNLDEIVITGHSLGGAVASLLHIILSSHELTKNFKIKTFAFSAPPTVSKEIIETLKVKNLVSYNFSNDIIPRLCMGSMLDLKYICISIATDPEMDINLFKTEEKDIQVLINKVDEIKKYLEDTDFFPKLYQPGEIYHIKPNDRENPTEYGFKKVVPSFFTDLIHMKDIKKDHLISCQINAFDYIIDKDLNDNMK